MEEALASSVGMPGVGQRNQASPDPWGSSEKKGRGGAITESLGNGGEKEHKL